MADLQSVSVSEDDFHSANGFHSLSVTVSSRKTGAGVCLCMSHTKWMVQGCRELLVPPFDLHRLHASLSSETAEMSVFSEVKYTGGASHSHTLHCLYDCRFWMLAGSRSTMSHMCSCRTRKGSFTRWSNRQAELRPSHCCTQPNR